MLPRVRYEIVYNIQLINAMLPVVQSCSYTKLLTLDSSTTVKSVFYLLFCMRVVCASRTRLSQTSPDQTTLEGSSGTSSMTCTGGCGYSF